MFPSPDKRDADTSATNAPPRATTAGVGWRAGRGRVSVALVRGREYTLPPSLPPCSHSSCPRQAGCSLQGATMHCLSLYGPTEH